MKSGKIAAIRSILFEKLNPRYAALSLDALNSLEEEHWDTLLPLFLGGGENDPKCIRAGHALGEIRREYAARTRWRLLSDIFGKPLPRGKTWAFTHTEEHDADQC